MDVDAIMDLASNAIEEAFGRSVTYTPAGGVAVTFDADFQERHAKLDPGNEAGASSPVAALDCRAVTLASKGIVPRQGDAVVFSVNGQVRTYEVIDVRATAPGSVLLVIGRAS